MRKVKLLVHFILEKEFPDDWDDDMILFHCNESSSCKDNLLVERLAKGSDPYFCTCSDEPDVEIIA